MRLLSLAAPRSGASGLPHVSGAGALLSSAPRFWEKEPRQSAAISTAVSLAAAGCGLVAVRPFMGMAQKHRDYHIFPSSLHSV